jgi:AcrR family transcriptional regulator
MNPVIRVTVDEMRHTLVTHLGQYHEELGRATRAAVEQALTSFDYEAEVRRQVAGLIAEQVRHALARAVQDLFTAPEVRRALARAVAGAFAADAPQEGP